MEAGPRRGTHRVPSVGTGTSLNRLRAGRRGRALEPVGEGLGSRLAIEPDQAPVQVEGAPGVRAGSEEVPGLEAPVGQVPGEGLRAVIDAGHVFFRGPRGK